MLGAVLLQHMQHGSKLPRTAGAELLEADGQAGSGAQQVGDGEG